MKKVLGFIISLIIIFSAVGCMDNNTNSLPTHSDGSNLVTDMDEDLKNEPSAGNTPTEEDESMGNGGDSGGDDDSSENENGDKQSNESDGWTSVY